MNKMIASDETKLQHAARLLKQYSKFTKANRPMMAEEMLWVSDVLTGEHAHMVELHRILEIETAQRKSLYDLVIKQEARIKELESQVQEMPQDQICQRPNH